MNLTFDPSTAAVGAFVGSHLSFNLPERPLRIALTTVLLMSGVEPF